MLTEAVKFKKNWQAAQKVRLDNGVEQDSYVYVHLQEDTGEPFYVGVGYTHTRPWEKTNRTNKHKNLRNKHGMRVQIVIDCLTFNVAKFWEVCWIKALRNDGYRLVNLTDGGDGTRGYKHTEEVCEKISLRMTENNPHHIPEVAAQLSGDNHWARQDGAVTNFHTENNPSRKPDNIARMVNNNPMSNPETAERVAQKNRGKSRSKESIEAQSAKTRGVPKTKEHNQKNSIGCKNYWDSLTPEQRIARGKQMAETRLCNKLLKEGIA